MADRWRLTLRLHRFEFFAVAVLAVAAIVVMGYVVWKLGTYHLPTSCFSGPEGCGVAASIVADFQDLALNLGSLVLAGPIVLPPIAGVVLGVAIVGKELERGTTVLAWSVGTSRRRWLLDRVLPAAVAVIVSMLVLGLLADRLEGLRNMTVDPAASFEHLGFRGALVPAHALLLFGIAVLAGAVLGRALPALLLAIGIGIAAIVAVNVVSDGWLKNETTVFLDVMGEANGGRIYDSLIRTKDGEFLSWEEAQARYPDEFEDGSFFEHLEQVLIGTPGAVYPLAAARIAIIYGSAGFAAIVVAFAVVDRRRPT